MDPLNPLLFNLVMDEIIKKVKNQKTLSNGKQEKYKCYAMQMKLRSILIVKMIYRVSCISLI